MKNNNKVFGILAILVGVVAIGFVYAGFTGTLNINGTGNVVSSKWDVYFANLSNAVTTGTANIVTPATISPKTKIGDYYVELATPGDSVTYTFDVVNDGNFDAVLTTLTKSTPTCTPSVTLCNYLTYTLKYTSNNTDVAADDELLAGETKNMTLVLTLRSDTPASALSSTELSVTGLAITLLYSQSSGYKNGSISSGGSTPVPTDASCFEYEISDDEVTIIGYDVNNCPSEVVIPSEIDGYPVTTLGGNDGYIFGFDRVITSLIIPDTVTTIGVNAFASNRLTSITIPYSVTSIGDYAFDGNPLTSVTIEGKSSLSDFSYYGENVLTWSSGYNDSDIIWGDYSCFTYAISSNEVTVTDYDYVNCSSIVIIPNEINGYPVTTVGDGSYFAREAQLTSVTMGSNVTALGANVFENNGLTSVTIPNSVTYIGESAFHGNSLTSVTIPDSVTSIGDSAFYVNSLESVTIEGKSSSSDFNYYGTDIWGWKSNIKCVKNNTSNVTNGCITWGAS